MIAPQLLGEVRRAASLQRKDIECCLINVTSNVEVIREAVGELAHESGMDRTGKARLKTCKQLVCLIARRDLAPADE